MFHGGTTCANSWSNRSNFQAPAFENVGDVEDRATRLGLGNTQFTRPERVRMGL